MKKMVTIDVLNGRPDARLKFKKLEEDIERKQEGIPDTPGGPLPDPLNCIPTTPEPWIGSCDEGITDPVAWGGPQTFELYSEHWTWETTTEEPIVSNPGAFAGPAGFTPGFGGSSRAWVQNSSDLAPIPVAGGYLVEVSAITRGTAASYSVWRNSPFGAIEDYYNWHCWIIWYGAGGVRIGATNLWHHYDVPTTTFEGIFDSANAIAPVGSESFSIYWSSDTPSGTSPPFEPPALGPNDALLGPFTTESQVVWDNVSIVVSERRDPPDAAIGPGTEINFRACRVTSTEYEVLGIEIGTVLEVTIDGLVMPITSWTLVEPSSIVFNEPVPEGAVVRIRFLVY